MRVAERGYDSASAHCPARGFMGSDYRLSVSEVADEVNGWVVDADAILTERIKVIRAGKAAIQALRSAVVPVYRGNQVMWRSAAAQR